MVPHVRPRAHRCLLIDLIETINRISIQVFNSCDDANLGPQSFPHLTYLAPTVLNLMLLSEIASKSCIREDS